MNTSEISHIALFLKKISIALGELLERVQNEHSLSAMVLLLALSFVYGLVHAAGPGHGKTLVASYFTANDQRYTKALSVALMIAVVHTFSAFCVTYLLYYLFQHIFSIAMVTIEDAATKISGLLIMGIGVYLFYGKYKHYAHARQIKWSDKKLAPCTCASCKTQNTTDLALILAAGLIPCPGTITVFLFSISLQLYWTGFFSAIAMSLGMSCIIAITALASVKIRKSSQKSYANVLKYLDFGATLLIIFLGIILLFT